MEAYEAGERDFGESRVQELLPKYEALPKDIRWHFIGHLQTNKVKQIVPFVHMIHSVDSVRLLETINKEAEKIGRRVKVLLEVHVAKEETKSGFTPEEFLSLASRLSPIAHSSPSERPQISMGMSDDYIVAIEEGSTMVRIGSTIFGFRTSKL